MRGDEVTADSPSYASRSVSVHLVRGVIGFGSLVAAFALLGVLGWPSLLLLPVGVVALRGCPACWVLGLVQTVSRGRLERRCEEGGACRLERAVE
ncbi:hypothetical protein ACIRBX_00450 [Kitasatospora sp. NPDC096147]|uniref:hypothetical protein n=1 Tax=Kitasatospora sp. NPDC096147 TaxID=3364093 RepID=UPI0038263554